jgi:hypothetical protein
VPLQNRVTPWGELVRAPDRGQFTGNRGVLHDDSQEIVRLRVPGNRRWIYCVLEFKGRQRQVMQPGRWTELFFRDEPTAWAAGHRPCAECQRERFNQFVDAWMAADLPCDSGAGRGGRPKVDEIDRVLEAARIARDGRKVTYQAAAAELPEGVMVAVDGLPWVVGGGRLTSWAEPTHTRPPPAGDVEVLTPRPTVGALRHGFTEQGAGPTA